MRKVVTCVRSAKTYKRFLIFSIFMRFCRFLDRPMFIFGLECIHIRLGMRVSLIVNKCCARLRLQPTITSTVTSCEQVDCTYQHSPLSELPTTMREFLFIHLHILLHKFIKFASQL
jgi:hypothetical protein